MAPLLMGLLRGGPVAYKLIERFLAEHQPVGEKMATERGQNIYQTLDSNRNQAGYGIGFTEKPMTDDLLDMLVEHKKFDSDRNNMVDMLKNLQELKTWEKSLNKNSGDNFYYKNNVSDSRSVLSEALKEYTEPPTQVFPESEGAPRTVIPSERIPARMGIWMDVLRDFKENR